MGTGEGMELLVHVGGDGHLDGGAVVASDPGPGAVGGEGEFFGQVGEGAAPVGELLVEAAVGVVVASEEFALPECVVGVLDR